MGESNLVNCKANKDPWLMPKCEPREETSDEFYERIEAEVDAEIAAEEAKAKAEAKAKPAKRVVAAPPPQIAGNGPMTADLSSLTEPLVPGPTAEPTVTATPKPKNVQYRNVVFNTGDNQRGAGRIAVVKAGSNEREMGNYLSSEGFDQTPIRLKDGRLVYVPQTMSSTNKAYLQVALENGNLRLK